VTFAVSFSQLLLSLVFATAALAKLADRTGTRRAIEEFGIPSRLSAAGATGLPLAEAAAAAALVAAATSSWGALAALALLVIFSVAIIRTLRAGSAPDCNCFGGLAQTAVGRGTLYRNLLLGALAAFVALSGESVSAVRWITVPAAGDRPAIVFLVACVAGLGCFCWALLQQNGRLLRRLEAEGAPAAKPATMPPLERGDAAPSFDGHDLHGQPVSLDSLLVPGRPVALFFTDPGCGACELVLDAVAQAQRERADELTLAVISGGSIDRIEVKAAEFGLDRVVPQGDKRLLDAYRVKGFPTVVEIDATGAIATPAALGPAAVRQIVLGTSPEVAAEPIEVAVP
jgi:hypothetical protein